jgi:hypothetical protein
VSVASVDTALLKWPVPAPLLSVSAALHAASDGEVLHRPIEQWCALTVIVAALTNENLTVSAAQLVCLCCVCGTWSY